MKITLLDPGINSLNLGDQIISQSIRKILEAEFGDCIIQIPTHDRITSAQYNEAMASDLLFFGGTNILSCDWIRRKQWNISLSHLLSIKPIILMGCGYRHVSPRLPGTRYLTKQLQMKALDRNIAHSVRDISSKEYLDHLGLKSFLTACPTMWNLDCAGISQSKSENVVFTLTDYLKSPAEDLAMYHCLAQNYSKLYFWPQGSRDIAYLDQLGISAIPISPTVNEYDKFLSSENCDYVGTRLHGGIRALQHKKRTIILSVDTRSSELSRITKLRVLPRSLETQQLNALINSRWITDLSLPIQNIAAWIHQFK